MIVVVAEGDEEGGAYVISEKIKKEVPDLDVRISVLGHIQRGGKPSCMDRVLATRMGLASVEFIVGHKRNGMVGIKNDEIKFVPFEKCLRRSSKISSGIINVLKILTSEFKL
jgi:6-phosphofructokinase 1